MTDSELSAAVRNLLGTCEPESVRLDYKETVSINTESGKKELAKDVSSFANEQGGVVLYGVPETRVDDLPRPKPLAECGMEIDPGLPERIEDILMSAVQPPLHALTIKLVGIEEIRPKQLLLVYHPESYWKPHMVEGYRDHRYYRRGNFRTIRMTEREIEAAYRGREDARRHANEFFDRSLFGPAHGLQIRAIACPVMPGRFKERMLQPSFRDWLDANRPMGPQMPTAGKWVPFLDGWRFAAADEGSTSGKQYDIRVFHNGAVCLNLDPHARRMMQKSTLLLDRVARHLRDLFVNYSATIFSALSLNCPVVVRFALFHAVGLKGATSADAHAKREDIRSQIAQSGQATIGHTLYEESPAEPGQPYADGQDMMFDEETSTDEMIERPDDFMSRLMTRISTGFGLWADDDDTWGNSGDTHFNS